MIIKAIAIYLFHTPRHRPAVSVSTPGLGQGAGPARYEFCVSRTKLIAGGAGVSLANGVSPEFTDRRLAN